MPSRNRRPAPALSRVSSIRLTSTLLIIAASAVRQTEARPADASPPADFFVAPGGDDGWSGTRPEPAQDGDDGPFATPRRARDAVRELLARERDRPVVVELRGGTYVLEAPLVLGPEDSGTGSTPVVWRAREGERPVLSGGRKLEGFAVEEDGRWTLELPEVRDGRWSFTQLFVAGQRRFRPRLPKDGWHRIAGERPPTEENADRGHDRFVYAEGDIGPDWHRLGDVEVFAIHRWSASRMRIGSVDPESRTVTFTGPTRTLRRWGAFEEGHRWAAINVREALSEPGEFYLDRDSGVLSYRPREGEDPESTAVVAPRLPRLLRLAGDAEAGRAVEHLRFRGLTFAHQNWTTPPEGNSYPQAEIHVPAAIGAEAARDVRFTRCVVRHTGGYAMAFGAGSRNVTVEGCELVDLGAGGVKIGHTAEPFPSQPRRDEAATHVRNVTVRDTLIAHGGRLHPAAVGVWIGHASHNTVERCEIHDLYYTGVSVGWSWGYSPSLAHHNAIAHNRIHHIGQGVLSDMGGVYTLGVSPGTVVHHNRIHHVWAHDYGGWGLYTDEGSTGIEMRSNVVYKTKTGSFHQHYGKENLIANNILADSHRWQLQRTRTEDHLSFRLVRNIVWWQTGPLLGSNWRDDHFVLDRNIYWNAAGKPVRFPGGLTTEEWRAQRGHDKHSVVTDPMFVDPGNDDWRLRPDAPVDEIGFERFDPRDNGRRREERLTADLPEVPVAFRE